MSLLPLVLLGGGLMLLCAGGKKKASGQGGGAPSYNSVPDTGTSGPIITYFPPRTIPVTPDSFIPPGVDIESAVHILGVQALITVGLFIPASDGSAYVTNRDTGKVTRVPAGSKLSVVFDAAGYPVEAQYLRGVGK